MTAPFQLADTEREILIRYYRDLICPEEGPPNDKRKYAARMAELIRGRSLKRVAEMELEKGLA